jgi:hypothetical protein
MATADDDLHLGALLRLIRKRAAKTQVQLSGEARVPRLDVIKVENGRCGEVAVDRVRQMFAAADGRARLTGWYNGALADGLLDERHAAIAEGACRLCQLRGWLTFLELSFSEFGERGSIDLLALHERRRAAAVCEVKSAFGSLEEMNRSLDAKVRLAPTLTFKRFGWQPLVVARILIVPRDTSIRRQIERFPATMNSLYPGRTPEVRAWLRNPATPLGAIWFVDDRSQVRSA